MDETETKKETLADESASSRRESLEQGIMDREELEGDYLPFKSTAMIALLFAVFCSIGLVFPALTILSFVSILFSIWVVRSFKTPARYSGLKVAQFALLLSVAVTVFLLTYQQGRKWYIQRTAYQHSELVAQAIVDGELEKVFEYMKEPFLRYPKDTDLSAAYSGAITEIDDTSNYQKYRAWSSIPPISVIRRDNANGTLRFVGFKNYTRAEVNPLYEQVACDYHYQPRDSSITPATFRMVFLRRDYGGNAGLQWRVREIKVVEGDRFEGKLELKDGKFQDVTKDDE